MKGYKKVVAAYSLSPYHSAPPGSNTTSDEDLVTRDNLIGLTGDN